MPFGLKNARATYQRSVNQMFAYHIGKTVEVYVHDMLVKNKKENKHVTELTNVSKIIDAYQMKLNPMTCAYAIGSGKVLVFMVS